ncbi:MAG: hypothetical protein AAFZ17_15715 [Cyanobacteria bacterium J06650_10]
MSSPIKKEDKTELKDKIEIAQGCLNLVQGLIFFIVLIMLFLRPKAINSILTRAGFVEGDFGIFKWEKQLAESDSNLVNAAEQIEILNQQLQGSNDIIAKLQEEVKSEDVRVEAQINANQAAVQQATSVDSQIQTTLEDNTPLLNPRVDADFASWVRIISEYEIQIFYNRDKSGQEEEAFDIKRVLETEGVRSEIQVLSQQDRASSDQIRYFAENERDVAFALQNVLRQSYSARRFNLQTVYTPSPNSVSIFLKS